jgi:cytochrome d ubiquinol oxidase subunit I
MDVVWLSRLQFALTIMFHYIFPPLTIGLGVVMVWLEGRFLATRDSLYETAARFWTRIFAINFAIGVATGIVMEFQFGTNWAAYSRFVGDVFGSALAAEGIFAFFLESGFLAVLVFGWDRVSPRMHFIATVMVSLGSIFSAIWIVVANSWQQTPAGSHVVPMLRDGVPLLAGGQPVTRAEVVDFWAVVFNPSTVHRLIHVWLGAFIMGAFFVMSISAYYLLRRRHEEFARRSFAGALLFATVFSLAAVISGDLQAKNVYRHQPAKLAAFEGRFATGRGNLSIIGLPDEAAATVHGEVAVPGLLSFLLTGDSRATVLGLDAFRPEDRPPVVVPYVSYHVMVGLGFAFVALTLLACLLLWRRRLFTTRWLLWVFVFAVIGPAAANQLGWVAAEVGRQPWVVQPPFVRGADGEPIRDAAGFLQYDGAAGMRTADAVSPAVRANQVLASIVLFGLIYVALAALWVYVLDHKIKEGPAAAPGRPPDEGLVAAAVSVSTHADSYTDLGRGPGK